MKRQAFSLFTLVFILLSACQSASPETQQETPTASDAPDAGVSLIPASVEDVEILATNFYRDAFRVWRVVGLLANRSDQPIGAIALNIEYLDSSGEALAQETDYSVAVSIAPGQTAPFSTSPFEDLSAVGEVNISVAEAYVIDVIPVQLDLLNERILARRDGIIQVTGEILNPSSDPVMLERIAGVVFSSDNEPLMANESDAGPRLLEPGEQAPFRIFLFGNTQAGGSMEYQTYISAISFEEAPSFEVTFLEDEYSYVDQLGQLHIVGEVQNSDDTALDIRLLCGLYNADGEVLDVVSYNVMPSSLGPGETAPYEVIFQSLDPEAPLDLAGASWSMQLDRFRTQAVDRASFELSIHDDAVEFSTGQAVFTGQLVNDSGGPIPMVLVVAGLRDPASGQIVATGRTLLMSELGDGEGVDYEVVVSLDPALNPASLEPFVVARGR